MGKLRTINHPGIETQEVDMSGSTEQLGGTTTLVMGFFPQGESNKPVRPTTISAVKNYFGTPENEAERYAYYAAKTVFDNGGNLIASRIPYNNNSQYLTPAVKYNIEEWSTKKITDYSLDDNPMKVTKHEVAEYTHTYLDSTEKTNFYHGVPGLKIYNSRRLDYIDAHGINVLSDATITNTISSSIQAGDSNTTEYYTIATKLSSGRIPTSQYNSINYDNIAYDFNFKTTVIPESLGEPILNDNGIAVGFKSFDVKIDFVTGLGEPETLSFSQTHSQESLTALAESDDKTTTLPVTAEFNVQLADPEDADYGSVYMTIRISNDEEYSTEQIDLCYPLLDSTFDTKWIDATYAPLFDIIRWTCRNDSGELNLIHRTLQIPAETGYAYAESALSNDAKSDFYYDAVRSSPTTALVDAYDTNGDTVKSIAIKSYYKSGEGTEYPEMETTDYLELRLWDSSINSLSDLTTENSSSFDIIHRVYNGSIVDEHYVINNSSFKSAPVSTNVTEGYYPEEGEPGSIDGVNSDSLALTANDEWSAINYPQIETRDPFGTGPMKVLSYIPVKGAIEYMADNFFQFVSPYSTIESAVKAKTQKYQWIHWYSPKQDVVGGKHILLARTLGVEENDVPVELSEIENVVAIVPNVNKTGYIPLEEYQDYRDEARKPDVNTIVIANITEQKFGSDIFNNAVRSDGESTKYDYPDEVLGIVPVLMGGFQSLPRQSRIELPEGITNSKLFDAVESMVRGSSIENDPAPEADHVDIKAVMLNPDGFVRNLGTVEGGYDAFDTTYSNELLSTIPAIDLNAKYKPNGAKVNYVTLAVCQLSLSKVNDNKIAVTVLETFTGSLDPAAKGEDGQTSMFIDNIVNNEDTGSTYVRLFSNYQSRLNGSESETSTRREVVAPANNDTKVTIAVPASMGTELWWAKDKPSMSLGFTNEQTKKYISYATIVASMENTFDALSNVDEEDIDIVVDAGISTIANYIKRKIDENPELTKAEYDVFWENITDVVKVAGWKSICSKLTTFCQTTRKDCISLLDAPRNLCVKDNVKLAQPGGKYSVDFDILPKFNYLGTMNSSYAAGYCDWFLGVDDFTAKNVWIPPSIAAEGAIIYTDYNSNYWMAPAGQSRGNVTWAVDVAFNPNAAQQDSIYSKGWNYALSSSGSIMVWGQKTMLNSSSSFNRINVRRLFCRLERLVRKNSKWVIFEINNERTRNIYKDRINPIFDNVKAMGGISRYEIICDTRNNTPAVVEANEFRAAAMVTPESVAEYIIITFFNVGQTMDFSELYGQL